MAINRGFGIDIGGSGIKGAAVDLEDGQLVGERLTIETPQPATPTAIADVVTEITRELGWSGPVGIAAPSVIKSGTTHSAANIDASWIGTPAVRMFAERLDLPPGNVTMLNDADAAGVAEMRFGDAVAQHGVVALLTLGTGIGSALFHDAKLLPNTELGHLEIDGHNAERRAAPSAKDREGLSYPEWAKRIDRYLTVLENLIWPDLFILGGGISADAAQWLPLLDTRTPITIASLQHNAGIVGAATAAANSADEGSR